MKRRISLKWIFYLLGSAMFFACSENYEGLVEVDNSIENIQIKNGMLVFPNHETLENVINGKESLCVDCVNEFKSQRQMFEDVVAAESKQMDYLDSLSGEALRIAPKHTPLYEMALKDGLIKEVVYADGTSIYDYTLIIPYYARVVNKGGFFAIRDTLYQVTKEYVKVWKGANLYNVDVLANCTSSNEEKNIIVFDYQKSKNIILEGTGSLSRISFPAAPATIEKGIVQKAIGVSWNQDTIRNDRFTLKFIDKIGFALPNYTRDLYLQFTAQRKIKGTNSYGYMECNYDLYIDRLKMQTDGVVSGPFTVSVSAIGSNDWYTFYPTFLALLGGKTQMKTEDPYTYILNAFIYYKVTSDDKSAFSAFSMLRNSINAPFVFKIEGNDDTSWLEIKSN